MFFRNRALLNFSRKQEAMRSLKTKDVHDDHTLAKYIVTRFKPQSGRHYDTRKMRIDIPNMKDDVNRRLGYAGQLTLAAMLQVAARYRSPELAEKLWTEFTPHITPTDRAYTALASAYASIGDVARVKELLDGRLEESEGAKGVLLRALSKARHTDEMLQLFHTMMDAGFRYSHRHMVMLLAGQSDPADALSLLKTMRTHYEVVPRVLACNAVIGVCISADSGAVASAEEVVAFMQSKGITKDASTYSSLCSVYAKAKRIDLIERTCNDALHANVPLGMHVYAAYLRCCTHLIRDGVNPKRHVLLSEAMFTQGRAEFPQSPHLYTNMLELYIAVDDDRKIVQLQELMAAVHAKRSTKFISMLEAHEEGRPEGSSSLNPEGESGSTETRWLFPPPAADPSLTPFFDVNLMRARAKTLRSNKKVERKLAVGNDALFSSKKEALAVEAGINTGNVNTYKAEGLRTFASPSKVMQKASKDAKTFTIEQWRSHYTEEYGKEAKKDPENSWRTAWSKI